MVVVEAGSNYVVLRGTGDRRLHVTRMNHGLVPGARARVRVLGAPSEVWRTPSGLHLVGSPSRGYAVAARAEALALMAAPEVGPMERSGTG